MAMKITTVFKNGPSTEAVRIPKEFRLNTKEVWIEQTSEGLLIRPKPASWDDFFCNDELNVTDDFSMERNQKSPQKRDF